MNVLYKIKDKIINIDTIYKFDGINVSWWKTYSTIDSHTWEYEEDEFEFYYLDYICSVCGLIMPQSLTLDN